MLFLEKLRKLLANRAVVCTDFETVTPSDTVELTNPGFISVTGLDGTVVVVTAAGNERTIPANAAYLREFPVIVKQVKATGTTATGIIVLTGGP